MTKVLVPYSKNNEYKEYIVSAEKAKHFDINLDSEDAKNINIKKFKDEKQKLFNLYLDKKSLKETIPFQISIFPSNQSSEKITQLDENTNSITLGMFVALLQKKDSREFKNDWTSVTITGNIQNDGKKLKAIGDIEKKFLAVQQYAKENKGSHLFIYVKNADNQNIPTPGIYENNLTVMSFQEAYPVNAFLYDIFEPIYDDIQFESLKKATVNHSWDFIETEQFRQIKKEVLKENWNGYLIAGEGETGKSRTAYELCKYLMVMNICYAPVWYKIKNDDDIKKIKQSLKKEIKELNFTETNLLVIDNNERFSINKLINIIESILQDNITRWKIIITSRVQNENYLEINKFGIKRISSPEFSESEIESLITTIAKTDDILYNKLTGLDEQTKHNFITAIKQNFSFYPGIISVLIPQINNIPVTELIKNLNNLSDDVIQNRINYVYKNTIDNLNEDEIIFLVEFIFSEHAYVIDKEYYRSEIVMPIVCKFAPDYFADDSETFSESMRELIKLFRMTTAEKEIRSKLIRLNLLSLKTDDSLSIKSLLEQYILFYSKNKMIKKVIKYLFYPWFLAYISLFHKNEKMFYYYLSKTKVIPPKLIAGYLSEAIDEKMIDALIADSEIENKIENESDFLIWTFCSDKNKNFYILNKFSENFIRGNLENILIGLSRSSLDIEQFEQLLENKDIKLKLEDFIRFINSINYLLSLNEIDSSLFEKLFLFFRHKINCFTFNDKFSLFIGIWDNQKLEDIFNAKGFKITHINNETGDSFLDLFWREESIKEQLQFLTEEYDNFDLLLEGKLNYLKNKKVKFHSDEFKFYIKRKDTPLHFIASGSSDIRLFNLALKETKDINKKNKYGVTPLELALANQNKEMVKRLIENGAKTDISIECFDFIKDEKEREEMKGFYYSLINEIQKNS